MCDSFNKNIKSMLPGITLGIRNNETDMIHVLVEISLLCE